MGNSLWQRRFLPLVKVSFAYSAWAVQVNPQLEQVAEEGGGTFMEEVCKAREQAISQRGAWVPRAAMQHQALCGPWTTHHPIWVVCMWPSDHFCVQGQVPWLPISGRGGSQKWQVQVAQVLLGIYHKSPSLLMEKALSLLKILFLAIMGPYLWALVTRPLHPLPEQCGRFHAPMASRSVQRQCIVASWI